MKAGKSEFWKRVNSVLLQALERTPDEWEEFLDGACGDDVGLRREVGWLLTAEIANGPSIDRPVFELLSPSPAVLKAGERIGSPTRPTRPRRPKIL